MVTTRRGAALRRWRLRSLGVLVVVAVAACSDADAKPQDEVPSGGRGSTPAARGEIPEFDDLPEEQRAYFEDGKVTLQDYQEAWGAFVQCAQDAGVADVLHEHDRDPVTGMINYSVSSYSDELLPPGRFNGSKLNDCYQRWFAHTEMAFQLSDPAVLAAEPAEQMKFFDDYLRPCLGQLGVDVPNDLEYNDENWQSLNDQAVEALQDGRCDPPEFDEFVSRGSTG